MHELNELMEYLPFIIPLVIVEWALAIAALIHIFKHSTYRIGNRVLWVIIVLFIQIIGPIIYFVCGRSDE